MRFKIDPRDVPPEIVARHLGLGQADFTGCLPGLLARGFPSPDPTTGNFDIKAIDVWMDFRSGLRPNAGLIARDAASVVDNRLAGMSRGA